MLGGPVARASSLLLFTAFAAASTGCTKSGGSSGGNGGMTASGGGDDADAAGGSGGASGARDSNGGASCGVPARFAWSSAGPVLSPKSDGIHKLVSIKDPSIVYFNNKWHVFVST